MQGHMFPFMFSSASFGQHQGLVNVASFVPVSLVLFHVCWL